MVEILSICKEDISRSFQNFHGLHPQFSHGQKIKWTTKLAGNLSFQSQGYRRFDPTKTAHVWLAPCRCVVPLWVWLFVDLSIAWHFFEKEMDPIWVKKWTIPSGWTIGSMEGGGKIRWLRVAKVKEKNIQTCEVKWATFETPYAKTGWLKRDPCISLL